MNELLILFKENYCVENIYKRNIKRKVIHFALLMLYDVFAYIFLASLGFIILMFFMSSHFYEPFIMQYVMIFGLFFISLNRVVLKVTLNYRENCMIKDYAKLYTYNLEEFESKVEREYVRNYLIENRLYGILEITELENQLDRKIDTKVIINRQKFKLSSFIITIIGTLAITYFFSSNSVKELIAILNENGFQFANILAILLLFGVLYLVIKFIEFVIEKLQNSNLQILTEKLNKYEIHLIRILKEVRKELIQNINA
ncbi:hypothetical protein EZV73_27365 [Acidaminobacter sp. JC074]|uniref:serine incorporator domain-containing protein n=1 Tax=Acidaminobacter sp. JC074 TaxID=2530199 RepID=UPI001F1111A9|nr:serine incorporator domain-containing protein [Acidaminobacter sp. JC074]MCH4891320.1 hypothetical protein [Acidaminobacter sp. JC074]